jgi:outer membrane lipoprotein-sorting protein
MVISLVATILTGTVLLVPKTDVLNKVQAEIPQEINLEYPPPVKAIVKPSKEKKEEVIVLRKATKQKAVYRRNKHGKKVLVKEGPRTEFENENMDDVYKKEQKFFTNPRDEASRKKKAPGNVTGPLASIPAAVANLIASNIAQAKAARMPAAAPVAPQKSKPQTPEELFNVEQTIQEKALAPTKDSHQLTVKLPPKKHLEKKNEIKELKQVEVKQDIDQEVQLAEANQSKEPLKEVKRSPAAAKADAKDLLERVEKKYVTHYIKIKVNSEVTQALLERTKTYSGDLFLAPESRFKLDVKEPNKHMLLMNGKNIWVVDYPLDETQDKMQILHSNSAKNLKNQAFLDIFSGVGNLQKRFKIESSDKKDDEITYKLIPKKKDEQVEKVELKLDSEAELISTVSFWDSLGNKTQLQFSKQEFDDTVPKEIFDFKPPKDASITNL